MIVQVIQEIYGSVEVVEETATYTKSQPSQFHMDLTKKSSGGRAAECLHKQQETMFDLPSPNLRLANLMGPIIGLLKTFSSQVSRCKVKVR